MLYKSYINVISRSCSKYLIGVYSPFLSCAMMKCLHDKMKWGEQCSRHCGVALVYYWPSSDMSEWESSVLNNPRSLSHEAADGWI